VATPDAQLGGMSLGAALRRWQNAIADAAVTSAEL
jgi:hypothetical protein